MMVAARILVVEDEAFTRGTMVEALTEAGFHVEAAGTGQQALHLMERDGYQVLVADLHMPGTPIGTALAKRLHDADPSTQVLAVTTRSDAVAKLRSEGIEAATLAVPGDTDRLVAAVRGLLKK
ncbi:MAG TPA: response regulator [Acetobacteraceae bacterium]|nr:response regulator [Acetobacteraceae bacterium]